jgi:hypothetical protein
MIEMSKRKYKYMQGTGSFQCSFLSESPQKRHGERDDQNAWRADATLPVETLNAET